MKLLTFWSGDTLRLGVKADGGVLDITASLAARPATGVPDSMDSLIAGGDAALAALRAYVGDIGGGAALLDEATLKFGPCVPHPPKIIGVGLNYYRYLEISGTEKPVFPHLFNKFSESVRGHGDDIILPANSEQVDFEAELAIVIGKKARLVSKENALEHVLGYCNTNDISARDFQNATTSWVPGKCCDSFAPIGPYLVTADEVPEPNNLTLAAWVNGERRQKHNTNDMIFDCRAIVSGISRFFTLSPGDVILTGTPDGIIMTDPPDKRVWLKDGDVLEVELGNLGRLRNVARKERV